MPALPPVRVVKVTHWSQRDKVEGIEISEFRGPFAMVDVQSSGALFVSYGVRRVMVFAPGAWLSVECEEAAQ